MIKRAKELKKGNYIYCPFLSTYNKEQIIELVEIVDIKQDGSLINFNPDDANSSYFGLLFHENSSVSCFEQRNFTTLEACYQHGKDRLIAEIAYHKNDSLILEGLAKRLNLFIKRAAYLKKQGHE